MKRISFISSLALLMLAFSSCEQEENLNTSVPETKTLSYQVSYTDYQLENWAKTGSPYLENELDNAATTSIASNLRSQDGLFKLPEPQTRAFGVNPQQNRFWSMIRLKIGKDVTGYLKDCVVEAITRVSESTNIRFYNAINDSDIDPVYHIKLPHVYIMKAANNGQTGSSYVGLLGDEQYIYIPKEAESWDNEEEIVAFVMRALCNVAGMYNEQQRNDRDNYVIVDLKNVPSYNRYHFNKITTNFYSRGTFDDKSITLASTNEFGTNSIKMKSGASIPKNLELSTLDKAFLNYFYLPFMARTDTYRELDKVVYDGNNRKLSESERLQLQAYLNNGNPTPPAGGYAIIVPWQ